MVYKIPIDISKNKVFYTLFLVFGRKVTKYFLNLHPKSVLI